MKTKLNLSESQKWILLDLVQDEITRIEGDPDAMYRGAILASLRGIERQLKEQKVVS